jgi:hypothetical protein
MQIVAGANPLNVTMTLITGTLSGKVTDSAGGAALAGVSITLSAGPSVGSTTTATDGTYAITNIIPGTYTVTFVLAGYTTVTK